jgi:hypothetical protein
MKLKQPSIKRAPAPTEAQTKCPPQPQIEKEQPLPVELHKTEQSATVEKPDTQAAWGLTVTPGPFLHVKLQEVREQCGFPVPWVPSSNKRHLNLNSVMQLAFVL